MSRRRVHRHGARLVAAATAHGARRPGMHGGDAVDGARVRVAVLLLRKARARLTAMLLSRSDAARPRLHTAAARLRARAPLAEVGHGAVNGCRCRCTRGRAGGTPGRRRGGRQRRCQRRCRRRHRRGACRDEQAFIEVGRKTVITRLGARRSITVRTTRRMVRVLVRRVAQHAHASRVMTTAEAVLAYGTVVGARAALVRCKHVETHVRDASWRRRRRWGSSRRRRGCHRRRRRR